MSVKSYLFMCSMLLISVFSECKKKEEMEPKKNVTVLEPDSTSISMPVFSAEITYLALGDSYTKAECEITTNGYPAQLVDSLKGNDVKVKSHFVIAQTGWRTDNLKNAINAAALQDTFDIVSLLIGVNNQFQGKSAESYRLEFRELLEMAIYYAKGRKEKVFVLSIPDYGATPFGASNEVYIGQQIDIFNEINKEETEALGVLYFDITPISREAKTDGSLTCTDNLHPSGKMYTRWVELIFPEVLKMVKTP